MSNQDTGKLFVDPDVAKPMVAACNAWIDELGLMVVLCERLSDVKGMGTLQSGLDLAAKFSLKARAGEDSLEKSLDSHIAVVKEMRAYFQACIDRYESVDGENAAIHAKFEIPG
ncbi:hypothetical protein ACFRFQ_29010 [Rhodococcus sp. NPDC056743]|uniref:hypothetical protein n=1 Tax=Rhodococcus sp. NPDC056743 TaxID=3345934 RepID=UPI00366D70C9